MSISRDVWVGLVELRPQPGNAVFGRGAGAFANAITTAVNEAEYRALVSDFFARDGFEAFSFEDIEPLYIRQRSFEVPRKILELAARAAETGEVQFDTFRIYPAEGD